MGVGGQVRAGDLVTSVHHFIPGLAELIGERVKADRERAGMTQIDLADRVLLAASSVLAWEKGYHMPRITHLYEVAEILGSDPSAYFPTAEELKAYRDKHAFA